MKDKDKGVRDTVLRNVRGRVGELNPSEMKSLVTSAYPNVRIFAGHRLMTASVESVEDFGFELLIDDDEVVRSTTIRALGVRKLPGWLMIMSCSLLDDNYVVQRAAMDSLLSDREKAFLPQRTLEKKSFQQDWCFGTKRVTKNGSVFFRMKQPIIYIYILCSLMTGLRAEPQIDLERGAIRVMSLMRVERTGCEDMRMLCRVYLKCSMRKLWLDLIRIPFYL